MIIKEIKAGKIKDSRGEDTIEVSVNGITASSPNGKSKGLHETPPYHKSINWNINFINKLKIRFTIDCFDDLENVERLVAGKMKVKDAKKFGANALYALESAILKALAKSEHKELWQVVNPGARRFPVPVGNAVGGGVHSYGKSKPDFQEFLIIPQGKIFHDNVLLMHSVYRKIGSIINAKMKNDEGAWQTGLTDEGVLDILSRFSGIRAGIDAASSSFYRHGKYDYKKNVIDRKAQINYINALSKFYDLLYIEDPLEEEDFHGFAKISKKGMIVGDDLIATQIDRLKKAVKMKSINAVIIKPNQNGSLIELREIFKFCGKNGIKTVMSHRSGETIDNALADYAFAFRADYFKAGISTFWREVKLKRMIEIEKGLK